MLKYDKTPVVPYSEQRMMRIRSVVKSLVSPITANDKMVIENALDEFEKLIKDCQRHYYSLFSSELKWKVLCKKAKELLVQDADDLFCLTSYEIRNRGKTEFDEYVADLVAKKNEFFKVEKEAEIPKFQEIKANKTFPLFFPADMASDAFFKHLVCYSDEHTPRGKELHEQFQFMASQASCDAGLRNALGAATQTIFVVDKLRGLIGNDKADEVIKYNEKAGEIYLKKRMELKCQPKTYGRVPRTADFDGDLCTTEYSVLDRNTARKPAFLGTSNTIRSSGGRAPPAVQAPAPAPRPRPRTPPRTPPPPPAAQYIGGNLNPLNYF
jgi:hypothetical protein